MTLKRAQWLKLRFSPPVAPPKIVLDDITLDDYSFPENAGVDTLIGNIIGKTTGSTLALSGANAGYFKFNASQTQLLRTATAINDGTYNLDIVATHPNASNSPKTSTISLIATNVVELTNVTFGTKTRSRHGGVPSGNAPGSAITGTGAADWVIDAEGDLVPSGTYGSYKTYSAMSYVLTLASGAVVNITMIDNAAHVKWKNNASLPNVDTSASFQLRTICGLVSGAPGALVKGTPFGDRVIVRPGVQNNVSTSTLGGIAMRIRPPLNGYAGDADGWIKVVAEEPVDLNSKVPGTCRMTNLGFDTALMTSGSRDIGLQFEGFQCMRPGTQTSGCFTAAATNGRVSRLKFSFNRFWGGVINSAEGLDISSGIYMPTTAERIIVEDCLFHDMYNPIQIGNDGCIVRRCYLIRAYNDFLKFSAPTGLLVEDIVEIDKRIPVGIKAHGDYNQETHEGSALDTTIVGSTYRRILSATGQTSPVHNQDGGIVFIDDARVTTKLGNVSVTQCFGLNRQKNRAYNISNPIDSEMKFLTAIYEPDSTTGSGIMMNGSVNSVIENCIGSSIAHESYSPGAGGGTIETSGSTVSNSIAYNPTFGKNWATIQAEHAARHLSPSYGAANGLSPTEVPTVAEVQAVALTIKQNWSPKLGVLVADGGAMLPDSTYVGAFFPKNPDGSVDWNDGSVHQLSLPVPYVVPGTGWEGLPTTVPADNGTIGSRGYGTLPHVRVDSVNYQDLTDTMTIGYVVMHTPTVAEYAAGIKSNIATVEISVNNGPWTDLKTPYVNDNLYRAKFRLSDFPAIGVLHEARLRVTCTTGKSVVLQGNDMSSAYPGFFFTPNDGTLFKGTIYLDGTNGLDTNNGLTAATAKKTMNKAKEAVFALGVNTVGGGVIKCLPGTYKASDATENFARTSGNRFLTVTTAEGVARSSVIFDGPPTTSNGMRVSKIRYKGVTFTGLNVLKTVTGIDAHLWCDDCVYTGAGKESAGGLIVKDGWACMSWTGGTYGNARDGLLVMNLVNNAVIDGIGSDALTGTKCAMNTTVKDIDRGNSAGGTPYHPDVFSMSVGGSAGSPITLSNTLLYKITATDRIKAELFFADVNAYTLIDTFLVAFSNAARSEEPWTGISLARPQNNVLFHTVTIGGTPTGSPIQLNLGTSTEYNLIDVVTTGSVTGRTTSGISISGGNV